MAQELLYTSAARGLKPGSRGFCTVVSTHGMAAPLAECLESLSGYRPVYPPNDPAFDDNPVAWSHFQVTVGGKTYSILSRVSAYGLDYTQRSNKLAHHLVLEPEERPPCGPAALLGHSHVMLDNWDGNTALIERRSIAGVAPPEQAPRICTSWQKATGDAGWAGVLAEAFLSDPQRQVYLLFHPGTEMLPLIEEALSLIPTEERWGVTFSTYVNNLPKRATCLWRCVVKDSPEANQSRRFVRALRIDLTETLGRAEGGALVESARTGKAPLDVIPKTFAATDSPSSPSAPIATGGTSFAPAPTSSGAEYELQKSPLSTQPPPPPIRPRREQRERTLLIQWSTIRKSLGVLVIFAVGFISGIICRPLLWQQEPPADVAETDGSDAAEKKKVSGEPTPKPKSPREEKVATSPDGSQVAAEPDDRKLVSGDAPEADENLSTGTPYEAPAAESQGAEKDAASNPDKNNESSDTSTGLHSSSSDNLPPKDIGDYKVFNIFHGQESIDLPQIAGERPPRITLFQPSASNAPFTIAATQDGGLNIANAIASGFGNSQIGCFEMSSPTGSNMTTITFKAKTRHSPVLLRLSWCLLRVSGKQTYWIKLIGVQPPSTDDRNLKNSILTWRLFPDNTSQLADVFNTNVLTCDPAELTIGKLNPKTTLTFDPISNATITRGAEGTEWRQSMVANNFVDSFKKEIGINLAEYDSTITCNIHLTFKNNSCSVNVGTGTLAKSLVAAFNQWCHTKVSMRNLSPPNGWGLGNPSTINPIVDNYEFDLPGASDRLDKLSTEIKSVLNDWPKKKDRYLQKFQGINKEEIVAQIDNYEEGLRTILEKSIPDIRKRTQDLKDFNDSLKVGYLRRLKVVYRVNIEGKNHPVPLIDIGADDPINDKKKAPK